MLELNVSASPVSAAAPQSSVDVFKPIRMWLDTVRIDNPAFARRIYRLIPGQCPFERDVIVFGHTVAHIPPLCKLNPLYEELVGLRFRAMCYLVDECGETLA